MTDRRKSLADQLRALENDHHEEKQYGRARSRLSLAVPPQTESVTYDK